MTEQAIDKIYIRNLALRCIIGIYPEERRAKQDVVINVAMGVNLSKAGTSDDIEDTPTFGTQLKTDYILGMAKTEGRVKILLDIDRVLSRSEIQELENAA